MRVEVFPEAQTPPPLRRQVSALQDTAWPPGPDDPPSAGPTHDPALDPRSVLLVDDGRVLTALDVLATRVRHAGESWAVCGLSTVVVDPARRARGHGSALVRAAARWIADGEADLTVFTCDRALPRSTNEPVTRCCRAPC